MKISIITINYNNLKGLKQTVSSVLTQTYSNIEYIVIDGGSNDGGAEFLSSKTAEINFWISEPDKGIYNAMNKGIEQATGDYLLFLNSGDWFYDDNVVNDFVNLCPKESFIYGNIEKVFENGKIVKDTGIESSNITIDYLFSNSIFHPTTFIHRSMFSKYGDYDEQLRIVSDWKFFVVAIGINRESVRYWNRSVSYFDMFGLSSSHNQIRLEEREQVLKENIPQKQYLYLKNQVDLKKEGIYYGRLKQRKFLWTLVRVYLKIFR